MSDITVLDVVRDIGDDLQVAMVVSDNGPIVYANASAAVLFGYGSAGDMLGHNIRDIAPNLTHGEWEDFVAHPQPGTDLPLSANAGKIEDGDKTYFMALFRDRTEELEREAKLQEALASSQNEALAQQKLGSQTALLKRIFDGTMALMILMGLLTGLSWVVEKKVDADTMAAFERVILLMVGILGGAVSTLFERRNGS